MPRKIPAPFKRPSINLEETGRAWKHVPAQAIEPGDIVADLGLIDAVDHSSGFSTYVVLHNRFGDSRMLQPEATVFAFVRYSSLER